jgi:hypothetical protein
VSLSLFFAQVFHMVMDVTSDFYTGVQAKLIDKTGNPAWDPPTLKQVRLCAPMSVHVAFTAWSHMTVCCILMLRNMYYGCVGGGRACRAIFQAGAP